MSAVLYWCLGGGGIVVAAAFAARRLWFRRFQWEVFERFADGAERSISHGPMSYADAREYLYRYTSTTGREDVYFMRRAPQAK